MTTRDYHRLTIEEFGSLTLQAHDLDPVYDALCAVQWPREQLARFLVAYWCCYHVGASCWLSERPDLSDKGFWFWLGRVAANDTGGQPPVGDRWPRAPERRHWRGQAAIECVRDLSTRFATAHDMVEWCAGGDDGPGHPEPFSIVRARVMRLYAFGPWIAYKVGDMLERVWGTPVEYTVTDAMYEEPRKAAIMVWLQKASLPAGAVPKDEAAAVGQVVSYLQNEFSTMAVPGLFYAQRTFGPQEAETVLCKWKSHMGGHYPLYHDLAEIRMGIAEWSGVSKAARELMAAFPVLPTSSLPLTAQPEPVAVLAGRG